MTATVTAGEITADALNDRIKVLRPFTVPGPSVGDCIANARRMHRFGDHDGVSYWLDRGAFIAGLITSAEFWDAVDVRAAHAAAARITRKGQSR